MQFELLTPEQRTNFERDGFLVVPRALAAEQVERLLAAGDRLASAFLAKPPLRDRPEYNHLDLRQGLLREPELLGLVDHAATIALVVQMLGPNIHLHSTALVYKRPEALAGAFRRGWHRDVRIPADLGNTLPRVGIKVCYCLTDFHQPDTGMTKMIRGSHLRTEPLVLHEGEVDPRATPDMQVCDPRLDVGDAILFENRTFHTAAPNLGERTSKVIIFGYAYRWMKQEIYLDPPNPTLLSAADPTRRQLLGGLPDVDTRPWALERWATRHGVLPEPTRFTVPASPLLPPQPEENP